MSCRPHERHDRGRRPISPSDYLAPERPRCPDCGTPYDRTAIACGDGWCDHCEDRDLWRLAAAVDDDGRGGMVVAAVTAIAFALVVLAAVGLAVAL